MEEILINRENMRCQVDSLKGIVKRKRIESWSIYFDPLFSTDSYRWTLTVTVLLLCQPKCPH